MTIDELGKVAEQNGLILSVKELAQLGRYAELLKEWNGKINLISRKDEENILERHVLHSLTLLMLGPWSTQDLGSRVLDVGTGGGLPGIPFAIARPNDTITLLDSIQKKITACQAMIAELGLNHTNAVAMRSEDFARSNPHGKFDVILTRAVAPLSDLLRWTSRLRAPQAVLFALKGGDLNEEIELARKNILVQTVQAYPLRLEGYDGFEKDQKQIVRVDFR